MYPKFNLKLVRSFSIGFTIYSPKYNALTVEFCLGCIHLTCSSKGGKLFGYSNYWDG